MVAVGDGLARGEAEPGGDVEGGGVFGSNDAGDLGGGEAVAGPVEDRGGGFGGIAATPHGGDEGPADLGCGEGVESAVGGDEGAVVVEEADFADEGGGWAFVGWVGFPRARCRSRGGSSGRRCGAGVSVLWGAAAE
jgi:hypothetical protein